MTSELGGLYEELRNNHHKNNYYLNFLFFQNRKPAVKKAFSVLNPGEAYEE